SRAERSSLLMSLNLMSSYSLTFVIGLTAMKPSPSPSAAAEAGTMGPAKRPSASEVNEQTVRFIRVLAVCSRRNHLSQPRITRPLAAKSSLQGVGWIIFSLQEKTFRFCWRGGSLWDER